MNASNKELFLLLFFFTFFQVTLFAQQASISGEVKDAKNNTPLPFANVFIENENIGATTDFDGNFSFTIKAGTYNLITSVVGYANDTIKNIKVENGKTFQFNFKLNEEIKQIKGVDISGTRVTNTERAVLIETKKSEQIVNAISSEQIQKTQDRTVSEVLRRVPGITLFNNNFVMIRGLSERYNQVLFNNLLTPSMDADKKAFSFDAIPSNAIDKVVVYKTASADMPGEFSGGIVKVFSKSFTEENATEINFSTGYRMATTGKDYFFSGKSNTDILGYDNSLRVLPNNFPEKLNEVTNAEELSELGQQLPNNWVQERKTALPDFRGSLLLSRKLKTKNVKVATVSSLNYSNTFQQFEAKNYNYNFFDFDANESEKIYDYTDNNYQQNARISATHNWFIQSNNNNKIEIKNFINQAGSNQAVLRTGTNIEEVSNVRDYSYRYTNRTFYMGQVGGTHKIKNETNELAWVTGYGFTKSDEPDFRRIRSRKVIGSNDSLPFNIILSPVASTLDAGRFYSNLKEKSYNGRIDYTKKISKENAATNFTIKSGSFNEYRNRTFDARWMAYKRARTISFDNSLVTLPLDEVFQPENINGTMGFKLEEGTNPSDKYIASNLLVAGYLSGTMVWKDQITLLAGVRVENNLQQLESADYANNLVSVNNNITSFLPSLNLSWNFIEKQLLRIAYFKSVNRPEFRELAPFSFYDFQYNQNIYGNANLLTPVIHNADLRWEYYPSNGEVINVALFYKHFINPIEMIYVPGAGSGGTKNFTFGNAVNGRSVGIEFEARKSLQFLFRKGFFSHFDVMLNAAYINTRVSLGGAAVAQNPNRPMMGQSPFIINTGLFFNDKEHQFQFNVLYNIIGKRLFAVGTDVTPDIYEMPRNLLDFNVSKGIGKNIELRLSIQDILNSPWRLIQDSNIDSKITNIDEDIFVFRTGTLFTLGINCRF